MELSKLGNGLWEFVDSIKDVVHHIRLFKEKEIGLESKIWIMRKDSNIEEYKGLLTPDKLLVYVPEAGRIHIRPRVYRKGNKQYIFIGEGTHAGIEAEKLEGVANAVKSSILIKWKHRSKWISTKIEDVTSTIDFNVFDNDFSPQFASHSFLVIQTKILNFLKEQTNIKLILMIVSAFLLGAVMGFLGSMVVYLILMIFS